MNQKNKTNNFIIQGTILGTAAVLARVLGLIYQIPLTRIIGDLGNGYYGYAYNVYAMVLLISSFSIPIAVSKMVSARIAKHQYKNVQRVFKASMYYVMVVSGIAAILTFLLADKLIPASQAGAVPALKMLSPVIFLSGILGVFRGYFQGYSTMVPTSFSQILEAILNAIISVLAAYLLVAPFAAGSEKRAIYGAVGSTLGIAAGVIVALIFLGVVYSSNRSIINKRVRHDQHKEESYETLIKLIFLTVTPVIVSSAIYNICPIIDQTIFAKILEGKKIVHQDISVLYGIYSTKYIKLVSVPTSIASALSSAIIPAITISMMQKDVTASKNKIDKAMKFTNLIAFPCTIGLIVLAKPIILLFGNVTTVPLAVHVLQFGAVNVIFNCVSTLSNAILQGLGKMRQPVIHALIALGVHIAVCIGLLNMNYGIYALLISNICFSIIMWLLNALAIAKETGYQKVFGTRMIRISGASLAMGAFTWGIYGLLHTILSLNWLISLIFSVLFAVICYLMFLYLFNAFEEDDYDMMPFGGKIRSLGLKLHLIETVNQPFEEEIGEIYEEEPPKKSFVFRMPDEEKDLEEESFEETEDIREKENDNLSEEPEQIFSNINEPEKEQQYHTEPINVYEILSKLQEQDFQTKQQENVSEHHDKEESDN